MRISGVRGEAPPPTLKVSLNSIGGFRNAMTFVLTGLDIEAKADLVRRQLEAGLTVKPAELEWTLARTDHPDADTEETASALLRCVVRDPDPDERRPPVLLGRSRTRAGQLPGLHHAPRRPATVRCTGCSPPATSTPPRCRTSRCTPTARRADIAAGRRDQRCSSPSTRPPLPEPLPAARPAAAPLGTIAGARSGDKGGNANVGVWVRTDEQWRWLAHTLTVDKLRELLPETADLPVTRHLLPNLRAVNFVIEGILGQGVAYQARFDPQAKGLGEWLRSRHVDIPEDLLS